jgi:predicted ATPase/class 3 adenylate cyclase
MECPRCGFHSPSTMRYCGMCGARLVQVCAHCGFANPLGYRFCGQCGVGFPESLAAYPEGEAQPSAEATAESALAPAMELPATAPLGSPAEGGPIILDGERRLATVILADVKGSTDLLEEMGTEAWVEMMNRILQILESEIYRYGGQVDQFRGDGLVAFFGAESAHEDDPERAILAALAMQEAIQPFARELAEGEDIDLKLRVGVNSGEVIVASIGDSRQHSEDTAMGEAIALASRMETAAEPGTVLVSENTYHLVQSQFEWQALGEISVKGVSQPVAVYRPLASRTDGQRSLRLASYGLPALTVGRDAQFEELKQRVEELRTGRGGIVLLAGDEGMGKSHLVAQVQQHILRDEALLAELQSGTQGAGNPSSPVSVPVLNWLHGHCRSYEQSWPYSMWLDLLRHWLGVREGEHWSATRDRLRQEAESLWGEQMGEHYAYLATFLSLPLEEAFAGWVEHLGAEGLRQQVSLTLRSWVERMAQRGPLVLTFEDVHWADASSLSLLEYCLPLCDQEAVLWLIMFRLERGSAVRELRRRVEAEYPHRLTLLTLTPLDEEQSEEMIERLVGRDVLSAETRALVVEKAEGNPYYIEELIHSLIREGVLVQDEQGGGWRMAREVGSLDLPDTLRSLLLARIDDLSVAERRVLQLAAVIGSVFWENVLRDLVEDEGELEAHLTALRRGQFIRERVQVPDLGMEYQFRSALVRDVAYESILSGQRVTYHRQVAEHLARLFGEESLAQYYGVVAYHYRRAGERRRELFYTLSAAERAQGIYANAEALEYYTRALALLDETKSQSAAPPGRLWQDWRLETLKGLGQVYFGMGTIPEAEGYFRQAIELGEEMELDPREVVRLYYWLAEALHWQGQHEEQIQIAEHGLSILQNDAESVETALMNQEIAVGYLSVGDEPKFQEFTRRTAHFLEQLPYSEELRPAYDHVARMFAYDEKNVGEAETWLRALERKAAQYHDLRAVGDVHYSMAGILEQCGDLQGAVSRQQQALELFRKIGDIKHEGWCLSALVDIFLSLGDLQKAEQHAEMELEVAQRGDNIPGAAEAHWHLGRIFLCQKQFEKAVSAFQETMRRSAQMQGVPLKAAAAYALGQAYRARGDRGEALEQFRAAVDLAGWETLAQDTFLFALVLSVAQEAYEDAEPFEAWCCHWREQQPQMRDSKLVQWYLEPAGALDDKQGPVRNGLAWRDAFAEGLDPAWSWHDPFGDCWCRVQDGLEIHAVNGRDLARINLSAPRVLQPASGDLVVQTLCSPTAQGPAMGGLLIWQDNENYVCLDRGTGGEREIVFRACLANKDAVVGRGRLLSASDRGAPGDTPADRGTGAREQRPPARTFLRLERRDGRVHAFCSADGAEWYTVGSTRFPAQGPVQVGLYAIGSVNRWIYPGAHIDGTAIRFGFFDLWKADPSSASVGGST